MKQSRYVYRITYSGMFYPVVREFETRERAEQWLRQIGKSNLIMSIERVETEAEK